MEPEITVGRIVHFFASKDESLPLAGIVTYVHNAEMVNICLFDSNGNPQSRTSVQFSPDTPTGMYCTYPTRN